MQDVSTPRANFKELKIKNLGPNHEDNKLSSKVEPGEILHLAWLWG